MASGSECGDSSGNMDTTSVTSKIEDPAYGWYGMGVGSDGTHPPFHYTIGLWKNYQHPELIVVGLDPVIGHAIHQLVIELHVKQGEKLDCDELYDDIAEGYLTAFRPVTPENIAEYLCWAVVYYGDESFPAWQTVMPDPESRFPWDDGYSMSAQTLLYEHQCPPCVDGDHATVEGGRCTCCGRIVK